MLARGQTTPPDRTASDPSPGSSIEGQGISFAPVDVPRRDEPAKEKSDWPFGPTDEPAAWLNTSGCQRASPGTQGLGHTSPTSLVP